MTDDLVTSAAGALDPAERWETTPPGLDEAEIAWWDEYSDVEERYCWVQTPPIQRMLRGRYVRQIADALPRGGTVLELGCGTGWLSILLAESGAPRVYAVDFSPEQIRRAEAALEATSVRDRVRFLLLEGSVSSLTRLLPEQKFDALVLHGFLHHLSKEEIRTILSTFRSELGAPNAKIFLLEPVVPEAGAGGRDLAWVRRLIDLVINLPMRGQGSGLRRRSPEEIATQEKIVRRNIGVDPRGPSPKEMPFRPGELEELCSPYAEIVRSEVVLVFSYHAAKNLLLFGLSYPTLGRAILGPYLWASRCIERVLISRNLLPGGWPVFELKEGVVKNPAP